MKLDMLSYLGTDYAKDKQLIKKILSNPTILVGWVDSFDADNGTVNIQPAIQDKIIDENSVLNYVNKPYLVNCWVISNTLNRQPQKGDKALILVLDEKSNNFFKSQYDSTKTLSTQTFVNTSKNIKSLANSVAIIVNSNYAEGIGTVVNVNGVAQDEINFTSDPQTQINQLSNPNLLINGDFRVNQRGQTNYNFTGKGSYLRYYSIDRWFGVPQIANSQSNLIVNNKSITINMIEPYFNFQQIIEYSERLSNKSITASIKCSNQSSNKAYMSIYNGSTRLGIREIPNGSGIYTLTINLGEINDFRFQIGTEMGNVQLEIEWCKLEIGSVATAFSPRPYAEELALCQRYYQKYSPTNSYSLIGTGIVFSTRVIVIGVSLPVTLRTSPTLTVNGDFYVRTTSARYTNDNALTLKPAGLCNNVLQIEITSANTSFTSGDCAVLRVSENTAYLEIDAEIYQ